MEALLSPYLNVTKLCSGAQFENLFDLAGQLVSSPMCLLLERMVATNIFRVNMYSRLISGVPGCKKNNTCSAQK